MRALTKPPAGQWRPQPWSCMGAAPGCRLQRRSSVYNTLTEWPRASSVVQAPRAGRARAPWSCMHTMLACLENRAVQQPATARARRRTELGNRRRTAGSSPAVRRFDYYPQKGRTSRTSLLCTAACMENRRFVDRSHMGAKARLGLQPMQPRRRGDPSPRGCSPDATRAVVEASPLSSLPR